MEAGLANLTLTEFIRKLQRYITDTDNVMYALGWHSLQVEEGTTLLAIGFSRLQGAGLPLFVINFGNAGVSHQAMGSLLQHFGNDINVLCRGLGFGHQECNQAGMGLYTIVVPIECVVCLDTNGQQLYALPNNAVYTHNFEIDLFYIRIAFVA